MKKLLLFIILVLTVGIAFGQKSINALFDKYAGKDGFVTVTISGNLLKLAASLDNDKDDDNTDFPADISEIRILAQEDETIKVDNFYDLIINDLKFDDYEEFMRVKESDHDLRMLVRAEGNKFREFLLIAGGNENAIIQIKGSMTFKEARKFSEGVKINHGKDLLEGYK